MQMRSARHVIMSTVINYNSENAYLFSAINALSANESWHICQKYRKFKALCKPCEYDLDILVAKAVDTLISSSC